mmetsp:Transcript_8253/g.23705  ORF Transcript_8253/g.23705 Transcript_8253/m.23705 type:complete len:241 (+) Transcript_8253:1665-2387(+)
MAARRGMGGITENMSRWWEVSPFQRGPERWGNSRRPSTEPLRHQSTPSTRRSPGTSGFTRSRRMLCSLDRRVSCCRFTTKCSAAVPSACDASLSEDEEAAAPEGSSSHISRTSSTRRVMSRGLLNSMSTPTASLVQHTLATSSSIDLLDLPASQLLEALWPMAEVAPPVDSDSCILSHTSSSTRCAPGLPLYRTPSACTTALSAATVGRGSSRTSGSSSSLPSMARRFSCSATASQNCFM